MTIEWAISFQVATNLCTARSSAPTSRRGQGSNARPPAYSSLRHRFAVGSCKEVEDGRGCRGGRGPGGARPPRRRRRAHARAAAADVGGPPAGRGGESAAGGGPGAGLARARGDGRRTQRLARAVPRRRRGLPEEPAGGCPGRRDRPPQGEGRGPDHDHRATRGQDRAAGDGAPFGPAEVEAMSRRVSPSTDKVYGVERVTRLWGVSRATVYRHRHGSGETAPRRPGPLGAMSDDGLVQEIRKLLTASPFHGEGHRKLWARLRFAGIRTSRRRVLRLTREHGLLAHQRVGAPHGSKAHDGRITTDRVDLMWGTDLTSVVTGEGQAAVFVAVDHCSAECVGVHASRSADRFEALEPGRQAGGRRRGRLAKDVAAGLRLRHDHGSQYVSHHFQAEIRFLGVESSPAFVREPEGNGCAERFIRTLKENLLWIRHFATVEELRLALQAFKETYNQGWLIERHGYQTPAQVRAAQIAAMSKAE